MNFVGEGFVVGEVCHGGLTGSLTSKHIVTSSTTITCFLRTYEKIAGAIGL